MWLNNAGQAIAGQTDSIFAPAINGNYAAVVSNSLTSYKDTSAYISFAITGLFSRSAVNNVEKVAIYPNPTSGLLTVAFTKAISSQATVVVRDLTGREIMRQAINTGSREHQLNLQSQPAGTYLLTIISESSVSNHKVIVND